MAILKHLVCPTYPVPAEELTDMNTIQESTLVDNARANAVKQIKIAPTPEGKGFHIYVTLSWKDEELLLVNTKKQPRVWSSLDRLYSHIETKYNAVKYLTVFFKDSDVNERQISSGEGKAPT